MNKQYSKEEYLAKLLEFELDTFEGLEQARERTQKFFLDYPRRYAMIRSSDNVTGDYIFNSKNCRYCFNLYKDIENCRYCFFLPDGTKDGYDINQGGIGSELMYEIVGAAGSARCSFSRRIFNGINIQYSDDCHGSHHLFGCAGLRDKEYCILNKQYAKKEYERLIPQIVKNMNEVPYVDGHGRIYTYGEFFPMEFSPFAYNETVAQEYFPLTKESAHEIGFRWKDKENKNYNATVKWKDLPSKIKDIDNSILSQVISCAHEDLCMDGCSLAFRIIPSELQFYQRMNLPLPRLCPNCRYYERLKQRNPLRLWNRTCDCAGQKSKSGIYANSISHFHGTERCPNDFQTSYAPSRSEIVYCEACYVSEIV